MANKTGNHLTGKSKSDAARKGRGVSAFENKVTTNMKDAFARIEVIAKRQQAQGRPLGSGTSVSYPIRAMRGSFKGERLG